MQPAASVYLPRTMTTRAVPWILAVSAAAAGCSYRANFGDCSVRCDDDGACPSGSTCGGDGLCRSVGGTDCASLPDSSVEPDASAPDEACAGIVCDDVTAPACASQTVLRTFATPGTCSGGVCNYHEGDRVCVGGCADAKCSGAWSALPQQTPPQARFGHTAVWTGSEMIVWGGAVSSTGSLADGARFDPTTGIWVALPTLGAPTARRDHAAVWTGSEMIVWGGSSITQGGAVFGDGARFNPGANAWTPLPTTNAPQGRFGHTAVWTGSEMIVWGGAVSSTGSLDDGARFDPATGVWTAIEIAGAPSRRRDHAAIWTGSEMIVWGGSSIQVGGGVFGDAASYVPSTNSWTTTPTTNAPSARFQHTAVWTGSEAIVWGGAVSSTGTLGDGARLGLATREWDAIPTISQPSPRRRHTAVWTSNAMVIWGGSTIVDGGSVFSSGAQFVVFAP